MLTDAKLRTLKYKKLESAGEKNPGQLLGNRIPDKDGMYVYVSPSGSISFRYDFRWPRSATGKRQCITYGRYPIVTLDEARDAHVEALRKMKKGINPLDERRQDRQQSELPDEFRAVAERWYEKNSPGKSKSWLQSTKRYLNAAYPYIGGKKMKDIAPKDISAIITPVDASGRAITAEKMRQVYVMVFDHAAGKEFLITNGANPARVLSVDLPETKHHASLKVNEVPQFLKAVDEDTGGEQLKIAVKLLFLTLVRNQELSGAKWTELDIDAARWEIPSERMKGGCPHVIPLSTQAVAMFRRLKELAGASEWVFPHRDHNDRPMQRSTINRIYQRTGFASRATPHGCRSTASTALNELGYRPDAIEMQLAHTQADEVRASYNHASYMQERRAMLQDWANIIDRVRAGKPIRDDNVIPLSKVLQTV